MSSDVSSNTLDCFVCTSYKLTCNNTIYNRISHQQQLQHYCIAPIVNLNEHALNILGWCGNEYH